MKFDFELTNQTKLLLGILLVALIAAIATQWGPGFYKLVSNPAMKTKRETLKTSKDLVDASKILKPIEVGLYQKTGLADEGAAVTIFDGNYPASVVRKKIDGIVKSAGIPANYQINYEVVPGKKPERISPQARGNLAVFAYRQKLDAEKDYLNAEIAAFEAELQAQAEGDMDVEGDTMDMFLDAWLDEADVESEEQEGKENAEDKANDENEETAEKTDDPNQGTQEKPSDVEDDVSDTENDKEETPEPSEESDKNQNDVDLLTDDNVGWEFVSLPDSMPISVKIELIDLILPMIEQHLVGAEKTLFEKHYFKTQTRVSSGFFGIGAKEATNEISFRPNSEVLAKLTNLIDTYGEELNKQQIRIDFLEYMDRIQSQIEELTQKLQLAPTVYTPESYSVKMKFKAEIDKLVNLNKIIETTSKWLMVRDLQISTDNKDNKINVEVLMIARVYQ